MLAAGWPYTPLAVELAGLLAFGLLGPCRIYGAPPVYEEAHFWFCVIIIWTGISTSLDQEWFLSEAEKGTAMGWVLRALLELLALCCLLLLAAMLGGVAIIAWLCYQLKGKSQF